MDKVQFMSRMESLLPLLSYMACLLILIYLVISLFNYFAARNFKAVPNTTGITGKSLIQDLIADLKLDVSNVIEPRKGHIFLESAKYCPQSKELMVKPEVLDGTTVWSSYLAGKACGMVQDSESRMKVQNVVKWTIIPIIACPVIGTPLAIWSGNIMIAAYAMAFYLLASGVMMLFMGFGLFASLRVQTTAIEALVMKGLVPKGNESILSTLAAIKKRYEFGIYAASATCAVAFVVGAGIMVF